MGVRFSKIIRKANKKLKSYPPKLQYICSYLEHPLATVDSKITSGSIVILIRKANKKLKFYPPKPQDIG